MFKRPEIKAVAAELSNANNAHDCACSVMLNVRTDGRWVLHAGSYGLHDRINDQAGYWSGSAIPGSGKPFDAEAIAAELIELVEADYNARNKRTASDRN